MFCTNSTAATPQGNRGCVCLAFCTKLYFGMDWSQILSAPLIPDPYGHTKHRQERHHCRRCQPGKFYHFPVFIPAFTSVVCRFPGSGLWLPESASELLPFSHLSLLNSGFCKNFLILKYLHCSGRRHSFSQLCPSLLARKRELGIVTSLTKVFIFSKLSPVSLSSINGNNKRTHFIMFL